MYLIEGLFLINLDDIAYNTVIAPTLPKNILNISIILLKVHRVGVTPKLNPTVANEDIDSKIALISVILGSSMVRLSVVINTKLEAKIIVVILLITISFGIRLLKELLSVLPIREFLI